jgi:S-DNA-T family DNA segregation ATPase FtsK/SpoIIIE
VIAVAGPRSALSYDTLVDDVVAPTTIGTELTSRVTAAPGTTLVLVDDAEAVDDVGETLVKLSTSDRPDLLVVVAGRNDGVRAGYTHWTRQLRRSKLGILLMPDVDYDADLLGTPLPRRPPVAITQGRGYLVNTGHATLVHLARPD